MIGSYTSLYSNESKGGVNLDKFIIDTRQRIDRRKGKMFRTYKDVSLTINASIHKEPPLVVEVTSESTEKESDKMTKSSERYNTDDQADFTQTEAEEWATEIALRIKEGNLDPIPAKKSKNYEQHDFTYVSLFSGIG